MLRRKRVPEPLAEAYERFREIVRAVGRAKDALTAAVPTTRLAGRPPAEALAAFEAELRDVAGAMGGWRTEEVAVEWAACRDAVAESLRRSESLRVEAPELGGFEALIGALDHLMAPLDAFESAAERLRCLRR